MDATDSAQQRSPAASLHAGMIRVSRPSQRKRVFGPRAQQLLKAARLRTLLRSPNARLFISCAANSFVFVLGMTA